MSATAPKTSLTEGEIQFFKTFGFIILRQHFTPEEKETIKEEFDRAQQAKYGDSEIDPSAQDTTARSVNFVSDSTPFLRDLPENPKFYGIATQLYGEDLIGHPTSGELYVGNTAWHPDSRYPKHSDRYGAKFAIYPEPVDGESGALRVVPGSHRQPFYGELKGTPEIDDPTRVRDFPNFVCQSEPGDVVAFNLVTWHASYGGKRGRPMLNVVYYGWPEAPEHVEEVRKQYDRNRRNTVRHAIERGGEPKYPIPEWHLDTSDSSIRAQWVDRQRELGFFDKDNETYRKELEASGEI